MPVFCFYKRMYKSVLRDMLWSSADTLNVNYNLTIYSDRKLDIANMMEIKLN